MRVLPKALLDAQRQSSVGPALIINIGDISFRTAGASTGNTTTCHNTNSDVLKWTKDEGGRILKVKTTESPFKQTADILLNNYDRLLYQLTMKGQRLSIGWGADTPGGPLYSFAPPFYVKQQTFYEAQGVMQCQLKCVGMIDLMNEDEASEKYTDDGTKSVGQLISAILGSTLAPFNHCRVYNIVLDDSLDDLWSGVYLGDSFVIKKGETRAYVLAKLFDLTHASMKPGGEAEDENYRDTIHIFTPVKEVSCEFTLDRFGHRFYVAADSYSVITPNEIIIKTPPGDSPAFFGRARDAYSYNLNPNSRTEYVTGLINSQQASMIANTILANIVAANNGSSAYVPMHCGLEIFDRVLVISKRSGREIEGAVGNLTRTFDPLLKEPLYEMNIAFGKWFDPRRDDDTLGYGYGFLGTGIDDEPVGTGRVTVSNIAPKAVSGGSDWANFTTGFGSMIVGVLNNVWIEYSVYLDAGSYYLIWQAGKNSSSGIENVSIDGVVMAVVDMYGFSEAYLIPHHIAFDTSGGLITIRFATNGKNTSSSNYYHFLGLIEVIQASYVGTIIGSPFGP